MKRAKYILVLLAGFVLSGCIQDNADWCANGNGEILIQLQMPDLGNTRAGTPINQNLVEYDIDHLDVLVFEDRGGDGDVFMYTATPAVEVAHIQNPTTRVYSVTLRVSENGVKQKLVMVANLKNEVASLLASENPDPVTNPKTKGYLMSKLMFDTPLAVFWAANGGMTRRLPSWGESQRSVVVTSSTQGSAFGNIGMLFSMAKVDIAVNANSDFTEAAGLDNFKLRYRRYYNVSSKAFAAPQAGSGLDDGVVENPSVPTVAQGNTPYNPTQDTSDPMDYIGRPYYLSEVKNKGVDNDKCFFVVIGGYYTADPVNAPNTTDITYYRIDFYDRSASDPTANRYDILRGHHYKINVTGVDGPGYSKVEDAASSVTTKMNATVTVWNEQGIVTELNTDSYLLKVTRPSSNAGEMASEWSFTTDARTNDDTDNKVDIFTNYGPGWEITKIVEVDEHNTETALGASDWLTTSIAKGDAGITTTMSINVTAYGSTTPRRGRIYVTAGKWTYIINVTQQRPYGVAESNSYMINHDDPFAILIPTSIVGKAMGSSASPATGSGFLGTNWIGAADYAKLKAHVLWSDVVPFGNDKAVVKSVTYNGADNIFDGKITVVPGEGVGNAGVILYIDEATGGTSVAGYDAGDKIVWSWHIWKTSYFPYEAGSYPEKDAVVAASGNGNRWMDRNLGATTNAYVATNPQQVTGFMYQWGRKDPFPGITQWESQGWTFNDYLFYNYNGATAVKFTNISNTSNDNLQAATSNPLTKYYYAGSGDANDWFTTSKSYQNDDLWGDGGGNIPKSTGVKSIYDPCPQGFQVPRYSADSWGTQSLDTTEKLTNAGWSAFTDYGRSNPQYGGYYPLAGYRQANSAGIDWVGVTGEYWQATPDTGTQFARYMKVENDLGESVSPRQSNVRNFGFSVRCVAE